jgi:hypothetical protein
MGEAKHAEVSLAEKSPLLSPVTPMKESESGESPVLMIATGNCALFGMPTGWGPKFKFAALNETLGLADALEVISTTKASFCGGVD